MEKEAMKLVDALDERARAAETGYGQPVDDQPGGDQPLDGPQGA